MRHFQSSEVRVEQRAHGRAQLPGRALLGLLKLSPLGFLACTLSPKVGEHSDPFPNEREPLPRQAAIGFVANQDSDTISVIHLETFTLITEVPVGRDPVDLDGPTSLLLDERRDALYVLLTYAESLSGVHAQDFATRRAGYVQVLARSDLRPLSSFRLEPAPYALALSPNGDSLAATHFDTILASVVDDPLGRRAALGLLDRESDAPPRLHPLCITPAGLAFTTDQDLFVACVGDDAIVRWDLRGARVADELDIDPSSPQKPVSLSLSPDRAQLAVSYEVSRQVGILSVEGLALTQLFELPGVPQIAHWLSDSRLLIATLDPDELLELDLAAGTIADSLPFAEETCRGPASIADLNQARFFLVCRENHFKPGSLLEFGVGPLEVKARLELGLFPDRLVIDQR